MKRFDNENEKEGRINKRKKEGQVRTIGRKVGRKEGRKKKELEKERKK